ncbi:hypothetical protein DICSQDRAFT_174166 [Dichomitus squalens LYAD-421 SS1]|uniref:Uncharacterized protein n=1 Tax=Dichomitus squalens (strain LYAD-421) TaxID=732165 RepID=R7SMW0_DICSQ|nr:uncharacterized protein DICSQDRAFT_174166 [Dichomitus squalens LYAD-421 SS1]EJF57213.1 hypothetical protein DICSQDRAFT_174166 [Dichomitus squalens LYAD-421 SS1]
MVRLGLRWMENRSPPTQKAQQLPAQASYRGPSRKARAAFTTLHFLSEIVYRASILATETASRVASRSPLIPRAAHARPAANGSPGKLYNPNSDPIRRPVISAEPDAMSDAASSSYSPRAVPSRAQQPAQTSRGAPDSHRQLFDPRKHDAVLFSSQNRHHAPSAPLTNFPNAGRPTPTPKSSGGWVSASTVVSSRRGTSRSTAAPSWKH